MFEHIQLPNPCITRGMIPQEIYQPVMQEIKEIERNDAGILKRWVESIKRIGTIIQDKI